MNNFMSYDPWANCKTRNGYNGDTIISMLQKSIRRGKEHNALCAAYEMYITSPQFEDKLWRRLMAISVEDIGFGDPLAPILVNAYNQMRKEFLYSDADRPLFFFHVIRYLCRCKKERSSDNLKNMIAKKFASGKFFIVPDYAYDMHTVEGREKGRDEEHFLKEASKVSPEMEDDMVRTIREQYLEFLKTWDDNNTKPEVPAFHYNEWQY